MTTSNCDICTKEVKFWSVGSCQHPVCHICSLRLRLLYQSIRCPLCKRDQTEIVLYAGKNDPIIPFPDLKQQSTLLSESFAIYGIGAKVKAEFDHLPQLNCPFSKCRESFQTKASLKRHVKAEHGMFMCEICLDNRKIFSHEYQLFSSQASIRRHYERGEPGFKGHPECAFCKKRFFSDEELYDHCKMSHEKCHVCESLDVRDTYYKNYEELEKHFQKNHFVCTESSCLEQKFVVFGSELELKSHVLNEHFQSKKGMQRHERVVNASHYFPPLSGESTRSAGQLRRGGPSSREGREHPAGTNSTSSESPMSDMRNTPPGIDSAVPQSTSTLKTRIVSQLKEICKNFDKIMESFRMLEDLSISCSRFFKNVSNSNATESLDRILDLFEQIIQSDKLKAQFCKEKQNFLKDLQNFPSFIADNEPSNPIMALPAIVRQPNASASNRLKLQLPSNPKPIRLDSKKAPVRWGEQLTAKLQRASLSEPSNKQPEQQITENFSTPRNPKLNRQSHTIDYKFGLPQPTKPPVESEDFPLLSRGNSSIPHFPSATEELPTGSPVEDSFTLGAPSGSFGMSPSTEQESSDRQGSGSKKKNKKVILFHIGI